jgi:oligosaccharide repeat unit polymerase
MIFLLLWLSFPFFWFILLKLAKISLLKINLMTLVLFGILFYQYLGLPILYFDLDPLRVDDVSDKKVLFEVFIFTSITIFLLLIGFCISEYINGGFKYVKSEILQPSAKKELYSILVLSFVCISIFGLYISKVGIENIAFFAAINFVSDSNLASLRSNMGNSFDGKYHWYYLFMNQLLKFCTLAFFSNYLLKPSFKNKLFFVFSCIVMIFSLIMATEKGPVANLLIALFLVFIIVKKQCKFPIRHLLFLFLTIVSILVIFYIYFMGAKSLGDALVGLFSRSLTGQIQPAYHYLQFFPKYHNFLFGSSMTNPMGIFPFESYNIAQEVMAWYNPSQSANGIVGSMPTIFWGELYANFGIFGVSTIPLFVGYFLHWFNSKLVKLYPTPISVAIYVWFMMHLFNLNGTSLTSYIFDIYSTFALFFFTLITLYANSWKFKFVRA